MSPKDAELVLQGLDSGKLIKEGLYFLGNFCKILLAFGRFSDVRRN